MVNTSEIPFEKGRDHLAGALAAMQNVRLPAIHKKLGYALQQRAILDYEQALSLYRQQIDRDPDTLLNYHRAIELQPQNPQLYVLLGHALAKRHQLASASIVYQLALQLQPDHQDAITQLEIVNARIAKLKLLERIKSPGQSAQQTCQRILFIDDRLPYPYLGAGYTRSYTILNELARLGYAITFYSADLSHFYSDNKDNIDAYIPDAIEIITEYDLYHLEEFLQMRRGYYSTLVVSRPHNMKRLCPALARGVLDQVKIIYDAEALYCLREIEKQRLHAVCSPDREQELIRQEIDLARQSDYVITVSEFEKQKFVEQRYQAVDVLGHSLSLSPTPNQFDQRRDILFVGAMHSPTDPNVDSVQWLCQQIFHLIRSQLDTPPSLLIAGTNTANYFQQQISPSDQPVIQLLGQVNDLTELYNHARLFVAPTRYAAGIPHKVHEAAAHGLPVVTTSLIANQLGWQVDRDLLTGDTAEEFARQCVRLYRDPDLWQTIRDNAMRRVEIECSPDGFSRTLQHIFQHQ